MAGSPKKRARREAAARAAAELPAEPEQLETTAGAARSSESGSRTRAKAPAKRKAKRRELARFGVATLTDFRMADEATEKAWAENEAAKAATTPEEAAVARVARDEGIIASWALGLQPGTIAERVGLTTDHVTRILAAHRERRATQPIPSSSEYLEDTLERLEALIERSSLLASSAENESVKLGSVRTVAELYASKLGLLQAMGRVSERPSDEARQARARVILRRLLDELRAEGVDQRAIDAAASRALGAGENVVTIEGRATDAATR